jgi:phage shock protein A
MADESRDALEDRLREVETDLADLRRGVDDLHEQIGQQADAPTDVEERAQLLTALNEQEALLARMEERRTDLLRRLGKE